MKIYGVMLVRNEASILKYSIYNALNLCGFDKVIVGDNSSNDKTLEFLNIMSCNDDRLIWTSLNGDYKQAELVNGLIQAAVTEGAEWIMPLDADEFPEWNTPEIRQILSSSSAAGYTLPVRNFAPFRFSLHNTSSAVGRLLFRVHPVEEGNNMDMCINREISFIQISYPPKHLWRASKSLYVQKGNHNASGIEGPIDQSLPAEILHAPIRSRECLLRRIENAKRLDPNSPSGESWHLKRMINFGEKELSWEWIANSTYLGGIGPIGNRKRMQLDLRLHKKIKSAEDYYIKNQKIRKYLQFL